MAQQTIPWGCCHSHQGGLSPHSRHGYYGMQWPPQHAHRESACREGAAIAMACSPWGWVPAEVLQPTLPPPQMGWYPVRRDGESTHPTDGLHTLHPVVSTPSRCYPCYGVLRIPLADTRHEV